MYFHQGESDYYTDPGGNGPGSVTPPIPPCLWPTGFFLVKSNALNKVKTPETSLRAQTNLVIIVFFGLYVSSVKTLLTLYEWIFLFSVLVKKVF